MCSTTVMIRQPEWCRILTVAITSSKRMARCMSKSTPLHNSQMRKSVNELCSYYSSRLSLLETHNKANTEIQHIIARYSICFVFCYGVKLTLFQFKHQQLYCFFVHGKHAAPSRDTHIFANPKLKFLVCYLCCVATFTVSYCWRLSKFSSTFGQYIILNNFEVI